MKLVKVKCKKFARVVGYIREMAAFNTGKVQEFLDRKMARLVR